ncbi:MAG: GT2 family glycosyltransferase [Rickettsiales bacterium]|jgi:GT2 family glycosyltransferase
MTKRISHKKLEIIIVSFESAKIIKSCLEKINHDKYRVTVIDNNSQDDTKKIVAENFSTVNLIELTHNIGYGRANNIALKQVESDYALILNPDAIVETSEIEKIVDILDKYPEIALASPILLKEYPAADEQISKALPNLKIANERLFNGYLKSSLWGAALFMRVDVFRKIGFFDENIFMYREDVEICQRAMSNGYQSILIHDAIGFHQNDMSSTLNTRNLYRKHWHLAWSKAYFLKKEGKIYPIVRNCVARLLKCPVYLLSFKFKKLFLNIAALMGNFTGLCGLVAFDKNGKARG